ncbi:LysE/ArgO family amino acid transporter [Microbacterium soli]|uniref:LysE/ArgO family amino acid transporter n=1 Tax=Microbacterium soli TaxID=446075 RepID=A0ABP7NAI9_9MICO
MLSFLAGLGLGLSLIVAIGAQNVFVLRQGLRREHVPAVVAICTASDAVLIVAGVAGLGFLVEQAPWLLAAARWAGALFLLAYALLAALRSWRGQDSLHAEGDAGAHEAVPAGSAASVPAPVRTTTRPRAAATTTRLMPVVATVIALTWLNPHVYLDTVLMLGSVAATHGDARWLFAAGAVLASCLWFTGLGFGARHLGRWLRTPRAWRMLDGGIAVIMAVLAIALILPAVTG